MNKEILNVQVRENIFKKSMIILIIFLMIFSASITYTIIFYSNPALKLYFESFEGIKVFFGYNVLPLKEEMTVFLWVGNGLFLFSAILLFGLNFIVNNKVLNKQFKSSYLIILLIGFILSFIFIAISAYNYSTFYDLFQFLGNLDDRSILGEDKTLLDLQQKYAEMFKTTENNPSTKYKWTSDVFTWWVCIFQIIVVIISIVLIGGYLNKKEETKHHKEIIIKKRFDQSKVSYLFSKISINNEKNISAWLIVTTIIVFIPQLFYVLFLSFTNSELNSLLRWTFVAPSLLGELEDFSEFQVFYDYSSEFVIKYLPIIFSGFLLSTTLIFLIVYIKGWEMKNAFFISQFILMFAEVIAIIIINTYSISVTHRIVDIWNENIISNTDFEKIPSYLKEMLGDNFLVNGFNSPIKYAWLSGNQYISQSIISICFTIVTYTIIINKMHKIKSLNKPIELNIG